MFKKAFAFITILLVSYLYLISSTLFINEEVYAVTNLKSSSKIKTINVKPFNSEYGIYKNGEDFVCPLGKGKRCFRSEKSKEKFKQDYLKLMTKYQ